MRDLHEDACDVCRKKTRDETGRGRIALAPCEKCNRMICYNCTNEEIRERGLGSIQDFQYFLIKKHPERMGSQALLKRHMCPYCCKEENLPRNHQVIITPPPANA